MNKRYLLIIIIIFLIISVIFTIINYIFSKKGNNINIKSADEIKNYILNLESYEALVEINVISNKNTNKYLAIQKYYKENNIYMQEILEPENLKNVQIIYDGQRLILKNVKFNLSKIYEDYNCITSNELSLISFINEYDNKVYEKDGRIILETNNKKLYINKEIGEIEKLEILDRNNNTRIYILYKEIKINQLSKEGIVAFSIETSLSDI